MDWAASLHSKTSLLLFRVVIDGCGVLLSQITMRRFVANLVLAVMAWSFVAPMALAAANSGTPACCRRDGKHQCMSGMSGVVGISSDGVLSFRATPSACPYRSRAARPTGVAHPQGPAVSARKLSSPNLLPAANSCTFESLSVTCNFQRGPPTFGFSQL